MPSQGVFEVLKANKYIHATSEWDPEDQIPPRFTGKFPLPDPRTHLSNPKLFTFTDPEPPRPQSIATHEASGTHNSLTDQPPRPQSIVTHEASDAHITIKSSNSDTSSERGISKRGVSDGHGDGLNPGPDGYTAQEGNFGGHNLGPVVTGAALMMAWVAMVPRAAALVATTLVLVFTTAVDSTIVRVAIILALVFTGAALVLVRAATVPRAATSVATLVASTLASLVTGAATEVATGKVLAMV